jgi:hypothetical protein
MSFNQSRFKPMKRWIVVFSFMSMFCTGALAYAKGPEVDLVDNKLSISAEAITLSRLLQLVDLATGMKSKVPPELANRNISVKFSGLTLADGVRKIFQGQPFDYIMVQGRGIIVTAASQTASAGELPPPSNSPPAVQSFDQPFVQDFPPGQIPQAQQLQQLQQQQQQQQQPMVQTPFGPIPNPRAQQPQQVTPQPPQNSLFPQGGQAPGQAPTQIPGQAPTQIPGQVIGQPVPAFPSPNAPQSTFGTQNPFGVPNQPPVNQNNPNIQNNPNNQNNGLFGNVPVFGSPGTQQR